MRATVLSTVSAKNQIVFAFMRAGLTRVTKCHRDEDEDRNDSKCETQNVHVEFGSFRLSGFNPGVAQWRGRWWL